jgi:hypothetical protein
MGFYETFRDDWTRVKDQKWDQSVRFWWDLEPASSSCVSDGSLLFKQRYIARATYTLKLTDLMPIKGMLKRQ